MIVSVPPGLAGRIAYEPALPAVRDQLTQRAPMGSVIKCQVLYDEPFWRADGLSGQALGDGEGSRVVFDNSPPEGSPGMLLAFVEGDEARRLGRASAAARREAVLGSLTRYFGRRAASPADYFELDWQQERWSGRLLRDAVRAERVDQVRGGAARAGRAHPLGRHRDGHGLVRLHGRRGPLRRARRRRGPHRTVRTRLALIPS